MTILDNKVEEVNLLWSEQMIQQRQAQTFGAASREESLLWAFVINQGDSSELYL